MHNGAVARWVILLRGINVGRSVRLSMADLRRILESTGASGVATYLQSGNAVVQAPGPAKALEEEIAAAVAADVGTEITVMVRSAAAMAKTVAANPWPEAAARPKTLHVAFLTAPAGRRSVAAIDRERFAPDEFEVKGSVVYVHLPGGFARTKLTNDLWERSLGVRSTMRNWTTVSALAGLVAGDPPA